MGKDVGGNEEGLLGNSEPRVMEGLYQDKTVVPVYRATETLHKRDKEHHHHHHHKEGGKEQHQEPEEAVAIVTALACHATLPLLAVTHANGLLYLLNVRNDVSGVGGVSGTVGGASLGPPSTARAGCVVVRLSKAVAQIRHEPSRKGQVIGSVALAKALTNAEEEQTEEERDVLGEWARGLDPIVPGR